MQQNYTVIKHSTVIKHPHLKLKMHVSIRYLEACWNYSLHISLASVISHGWQWQWHEYDDIIWLRHQMEIFSALLAICAGNSPVTGEFPPQRSVKQSFDVFFDIRLNKWLSKQLWGWWIEMPLHSLWCHCNEIKHHQGAEDTIGKFLFIT